MRQYKNQPTLVQPVEQSKPDAARRVKRFSVCAIGITSGRSLTNVSAEGAEAGGCRYEQA